MHFQGSKQGINAQTGPTGNGSLWCILEETATILALARVQTRTQLAVADLKELIDAVHGRRCVRQKLINIGNHRTTSRGALQSGYCTSAVEALHFRSGGTVIPAHCFRWLRP